MVRDTAAQLRARRNGLADAARPQTLGERAAAALASAGRLWERRLKSGWQPPAPAETSFPWAMVRASLAGLLPGLRGEGGPLPLPLPRGGRGEPAAKGSGASGAADTVLASGPPFPPRGRGRAETRESAAELTALILAGNTPLLAWPALAAALLAGSAVFVKMSRSETLWPRLFVEALAEADPEIAALVHLDVWPGEDARTAALVQSADAVVAYGGDTSVAALRSLVRPGTPFWGFGHALSVGLVLQGADLDAAAAGFACDVLMYDQGGCLSPQSVFVEGSAKEASAFAERLARALPNATEALDVAASGDAGRAARVRAARDLALFSPGARVWGEDGLRWTVIAHGDEQAMNTPAGHAVVSVLPLANVAHGFGSALGVARGRLSSVGVAGTLRPDGEAAIWAEGVSRVCRSGEMQIPPLDWPNSGVDLLRALSGNGDAAP